MVDIPNPLDLLSDLAEGVTGFMDDLAVNSALTLLGNVESALSHLVDNVDMIADKIIAKVEESAPTAEEIAADPSLLHDAHSCAVTVHDVRMAAGAIKTEGNRILAKTALLWDMPAGWEEASDAANTWRKSAFAIDSNRPERPEAGSVLHAIENLAATDPDNFHGEAARQYAQAVEAQKAAWKQLVLGMREVETQLREHKGTMRGYFYEQVGGIAGVIVICAQVTAGVYTLSTGVGAALAVAALIAAAIEFAALMYRLDSVDNSYDTSVQQEVEALSIAGIPTTWPQP